MSYGSEVHTRPIPACPCLQQAHPHVLSDWALWIISDDKVSKLRASLFSNRPFSFDNKEWEICKEDEIIHALKDTDGSPLFAMMLPVDILTTQTDGPTRYFTLTLQELQPLNDVCTCFSEFVIFLR